jgi:DNA ligase-1
MGNRPFEERLAFLKKIFGDSDSPKYPNVVVVDHVECKGKDHLNEMLDDLQKKGAEGLMLREPNS